MTIKWGTPGLEFKIQIVLKLHCVFVFHYIPFIVQKWSHAKNINNSWIQFQTEKMTNLHCACYSHILNLINFSQSWTNKFTQTQNHSREVSQQDDLHMTIRVLMKGTFWVIQHRWASACRSFTTVWHAYLKYHYGQHLTHCCQLSLHCMYQSGKYMTISSDKIPTEYLSICACHIWHWKQHNQSFPPIIMWINQSQSIPPSIIVFCLKQKQLHVISCFPVSILNTSC